MVAWANMEANKINNFALFKLNCWLADKIGLFIDKATFMMMWPYSIGLPKSDYVCIIRD
jgi:hypothetical protein